MAVSSYLSVEHQSLRIATSQITLMKYRELSSAGLLSILLEILGAALGRLPRADQPSVKFVLRYGRACLSPNMSLELDIVLVFDAACLCCAAASPCSVLYFLRAEVAMPVWLCVPYYDKTFLQFQQQQDVGRACFRLNGLLA